MRRPPGADRVLGEVVRARRAAGIGSASRSPSYDDLTAAKISARLDGLALAELRKVLDYEKQATRNRKSVLRRR